MQSLFLSSGGEAEFPNEATDLWLKQGLWDPRGGKVGLTWNPLGLTQEVLSAWM